MSDVQWRMEDGYIVCGGIVVTPGSAVAKIDALQQQLAASEARRFMLENSASSATVSAQLERDDALALLREMIGWCERTETWELKQWCERAKGACGD